MATSNVTIANRALQKLGAGRISSLTQDHPNARSMAAAYDGVRDALLREYPWGFAIKRASIAADSDGSEWGDWNSYTLPNDFIALIRDDESGFAVDWKVEGLTILSADASPLEIRYVARIDDPNYYDALFAEALSISLAVETCEEVTQSTTKKAGLIKSLDDTLGKARLLGAIEKAAQEFVEDEWVSARR